ncbi:MAG: hypothetical protein IPJ41_02440 [Phycisphaerales bacterium]|nr:hypothetical protein [Phycisphaerales bacterium]
MHKLLASVLIIPVLAGAAGADVWPHADGPMKHIMVGLDGQTLTAHMDSPEERMPMLRYPGEQYTAPADVLDDSYYSSQYGWIPDGFIDLPAGAGVFISTLDATPGLDVYEGGMRSMIPMHTFAPILGTDGLGDPWQWDGTMTHNWYSAMQPGDYDAIYQVYLGDAASGLPLDGYTPAEVSLHFSAVPAPGAIALLAFAGAILPRRRREVR